MRKRTKSREYAFQMMYHNVMTMATPEDTIGAFWKATDEPNAEIADFANKLFRVAAMKVDSTDDLIRQYLREGWPFERMGEMEKNVLRVGIVELMDGDAPIYAILDDYVTIIRKFSDEKTASFVNGVLDNIRKGFNIERENESDDDH